MTSNLSSTLPCSVYEAKKTFELPPQADPSIHTAPQAEQTVAVHTTALRVLNKKSTHKDLAALKELHQQTLVHVNFVHGLALKQLSDAHDRKILELKQRMHIQEEDHRSLLEQEQAFMTQRCDEQREAHAKGRAELEEALDQAKASIDSLTTNIAKIARRKEKLEKTISRYEQMVLSLQDNEHTLTIDNSKLLEENEKLKQENARLLGIQHKTRSIFSKWRKKDPNET